MRIDNSYFPLIAAAIGIIGVVLGALLNSVPSRRREHAKWLRDQRVQAYADYLSASRASAVAWQSWRAIDPTAAEIQAPRDVTGPTLDFLRASKKVSLLASLRRKSLGLCGSFWRVSKFIRTVPSSHTEKSICG